MKKSKSHALWIMQSAEPNAQKLLSNSLELLKDREELREMPLIHYYLLMRMWLLPSRLILDVKQGKRQMGLRKN